jgi:hypothetical protein
MGFHPPVGPENTPDGRRAFIGRATRVDHMELLAATGLFVGLALLAAIPLVVLLHFGHQHPDSKS